MRIRPEQLERSLSERLLSAYLICGDEPLLVLEAADQVRSAARHAGYERQVFDADARYDYGQLIAESQALSLFASRRLLDLRPEGGKLGRDGSDAVRTLLQGGNSDDLLLITTGKLDKRALSAAWVQAVEQHGAVVQCWPVKPPELPGWLDQRMRAQGLEPAPEATRALAERVEGNLLAAVQEIDKLRLLKGSGPISAEDVRRLVADSARFEVFLLLDEALGGRTARALRIAAGLKREGSAVAMIAAMLAREVRRIVHLRHVMDSGGNLQSEYRRSGIWDARKMLIERALRRRSLKAWEQLLVRCGDIDRAVKGVDRRDPWLLVEQVLIGMAGGR